MTRVRVQGIVEQEPPNHKRKGIPVKLAKLGTVAASGILLFGGLLSGSAQASPSHPVSIGGSMYIFDEDDWPNDDDTGTRQIEEIGMTNPGNYSASGCVDGVEGRVSFTHLGSQNGWIKYQIDARLYEDWSCSNSDLDGRQVRDVWIPPHTTTTTKFRVDNTDEGDDYIDFTIRIRNF